ncbi:uncharacterized protein LOC142993929 isoform X3 [Genypterus blacodes]|uniref:uncharacterized protein LOC142993929 isoform X3 n=1 Tax=Genypterus blacodes TaxID=154954 RepID=UPI003F77124F
MPLQQAVSCELKLSRGSKRTTTSGHDRPSTKLSRKKRKNLDMYGYFLSAFSCLCFFSAAPTRSVLHRLLICTGAILCMPVILGLAYFMRSKVKRQPLPRATRQLQTSHTPLPLPRSSVPQKPKRSTDKATPKSRQKAELVYAAISHDAPQQEQATTEREHATVYSSLRLS